MTTSPVFQQIASRLAKLCDDHKVCPSHGYAHAMAVVAHVDAALQASFWVLEPTEYLAVLLAALLHDADDRKLKLGTGNARRFLLEVCPELADRVLQLISYVSTKENGLTLPDEAKDKPYVLYPRHADRLEALGQIGIWRCWQFTHTLGNPDFTPETPRATTEEALWKIATPERFAEYQRTGKSVSIIDHFYDKLLHLAVVTGNLYLDGEMRRRHQEMVDFVLAFGRTGQLPPIPEIL